jgi:hypothetical protein
MLNLEIITTLSQKKTMSCFKSYFGPGGLGLTLCEDRKDCVSFEGGGGFVTASVCPVDGEIKINIHAREWDYQVKEFAGFLGRNC